MFDCVVFGERGLKSAGQLAQEQALAVLNVSRELAVETIPDSKFTALKWISDASRSTSDAGSGSNGIVAASIIFAHWTICFVRNEKKKSENPWPNRAAAYVRKLSRDPVPPMIE
jgi:hypothetical protein